jgi:hypothetical protein
MADAHRLHRHGGEPSGRRPLSREADRQLTAELRAATGDDEVRVTPERLARARTRHPSGNRFVAELAASRLYVMVSLLVLVTLGGIVALATGEWWVLVVAVALHAIGTLTVTAVALQQLTQTEHVAPAAAARLEEEGVADPDRVLTDLVEDYSDDEQRRGAARIVGGGANELTARPEDDPARATAEQRTAMTPTGRLSSPAGKGSPIGMMPIAVVVAVSLIALVVAIAEGGALWIAAGIVWIAAIGWYLVVRSIDVSDERAGDQRADGET